MPAARIAVLVAGTLLRFFLTSSTERLIRPLVQQGHAVDYYLALSTGAARTWRRDEYTDHFALDPAFGSAVEPPTYKHVREVIAHHVEAAGGKLRRLDLRDVVPLDKDTALLRAINRSQRARGLGSSGDPFEQFPLQSHGSGRGGDANRNFLRVYKALELLWEAAVATETAEGWSYTHALVLRDDTNWFEDFVLDRLLNAPGAVGADAHILACDARTPRMHPAEINDFAMLITRERAAFIGRFYSDTILAGAPDSCRVALWRGMHMPWVPGAPDATKCSSEELMRWSLERAGISVHAATQMLLPFQRCARVNVENTTTVCMHKYCQSIDSPLPDPPGMSHCKALLFPGAVPGQMALGISDAAAVGDVQCSCDLPREQKPSRRCPAMGIFDDEVRDTGAATPKRPCFYCNAGPLIAPRDWSETEQPWRTRGCGFTEGSPATAYLNALIAVLRESHGSRCPSVAYSVAFGALYDHNALPQPLLNVNCSFILKLAHGPHERKQPVVKSAVRGWNVVELEPTSLPFVVSEMRRNVKVFKMFGPRLFPWAKQLYWIDSKLKPSSWYSPIDFHRSHLTGRNAACAAFVGLPAHKASLGPDATRLPRRSLNLRLHANVIIRASVKRNVTSDVNSLLVQIRDYERWARTAPSAAGAASSLTLIDSAFFVMDLSTRRCTNFNQALGCAWFSEMACYSDRDQVSFPMAVARTLGISPLNGAGKSSPWDSADKEATYILGDQHNDPLVTIVSPTAHHWYYVDRLGTLRDAH
jgi:hypothetical protein